MNNLLTIVIPGYNVEYFIVNALTQLFKQTALGFEVIYVDDASTDGTVDAIKSHFQDSLCQGKLKVIELKTNGGPATARQRGLDEVATPFVTFMDADDHYASSEVVDSLLKYLRNDNPDLLMFKYITDHGKIKIKKRCSLPNPLLTAKEAMIHKVQTANPIWHYLWNKCYKTSIIREKQIRFEDGLRSAEDVLFNRAYLKVCDTIRYIDDYYYIYNCVNVSSITKRVHTFDEKDLLVMWSRETSNYRMLYADCQQLNCISECQPHLAKDLAGKAVKFMMMNRIVGGQIDAVIKNDTLYSVIKPYIWKSYIDCYFKDFVNKMKKVIKKVLSYVVNSK